MNTQCEPVTAESGYRLSTRKPIQQRQATTANETSMTLSSLVTRSVEQIRTYMRVREMRRVDRDAFRHLANLDESLLKDIGVSRDDVKWAMKLPLSQNASEALQMVSRGYKRRA